MSFILQTDFQGKIEAFSVLLFEGGSQLKTKHVLNIIILLGLRVSLVKK